MHLSCDALSNLNEVPTFKATLEAAHNDHVTAKRRRETVIQFNIASTSFEGERVLTHFIVH